LLLSASLLTPQLAGWKDSIDSRLAHLCAHRNSPDNLQHQLIALLKGGARFRGLLLLATVEGLGGQALSAIEVACAVEMIHLGGLVYQQTERPLKRSAKPSSDLKGVQESATIRCLAGESMMAQAFDLLTDQEHIAPLVRLQMISRLAKASGAEGLLGGQASQLDALDHDLSASALWTMHRMKAGSLMRACMEIGALASQVGHVVVKRLGKTGEEIGIACQLLEDLIMEENSFIKGTPKSSSPPSSVRTLGIALSRSQALQLIGQAKQRLREELRYPEPALFLIERMMHRAAEIRS
jgi:geranylgeranyl pyrophosphate synthase